MVSLFQRLPRMVVLLLRCLGLISGNFLINSVVLLRRLNLLYHRELRTGKLLLNRVVHR